MIGSFIKRTLSTHFQFRLGMLMSMAALCSVSSAGKQQLASVPCLTQSELQRLEPAIRERVQSAHEEANATPTDAESNGRLGMILHAYEQYETALACYQRARLLGSESHRSAAPASEKRVSAAWKWVYYLGFLQFGLGKETEAVGTLREAIKLNPGYLPARLKLAESFRVTGKWEESRGIYQAVLKEHPDSALVHYGLGLIESARGQVNAAIERYQKACHLFPGFGAAHYALGISYRDLGETAKAREQFSLFQRHQENRPPVEDPLLDSVDFLKSGADQHLRKGAKLKGNGHLQQALVEFKRALEADPDFAQAHAALLSTYLDLRQLSKAEEHYHAAVKSDSDMYEVHHNFGVLLTLQGKPREAAEAFRRALEINPFNANSHNNLGFALADQGVLTEAVRHFRLALENNPNLRFPHFGLGQILQRQGKHAEAIDHFLKTLTVEDEKTSLFMFSLADAYARTGNAQKAIHYAQQSKQRAAALGQTMVAENAERLLKELEQVGDNPNRKASE